MNTPKIELYIDGCFTYIREKDSEGLVDIHGDLYTRESTLIDA